jgi:rRNA maturation endonuclease Nob1
MSAFVTEAEAIEAWNTRAERTCEMLPTHSDLEITLTSMNTGITRAWGYRQCSNCLCNVFEGAKYCPNCGAKVVSE